MQADVREAPSVEAALAAVETLNRDGLQQLRDGQQEDALRAFQCAEALIERWDGGLGESAPSTQQAWLVAKADTTSHLGIYYRKCGDHERALQYLQHALSFHVLCGSHPRLIAAAHLNLATSYLEARRFYGEAVRHAQAAVDLGGQLLAAAPEPGGSLEPGASGSLDERGPSSHSVEEDCTMLAVAYHKLAEGYEGLKDWSRSVHAYSQVYEVIRRSLGPYHQLTRAFEKSSRCPLRVPPPVRPLTTARLATPQRLPSIPRARATAAVAHERALKYQLTGEVFRKWPPPAASEDEKQWYRMASRRG